MSLVEGEYPFQLGEYHSVLAEELEGWPDDEEAKAERVWFDRGMVWMFGFHHDEAVRCFAKCPRSVSGLLMAAHSLGPNYNKVWGAFAPKELLRCLSEARQHLENARKLLDEKKTGVANSSSSTSPLTASPLLEELFHALCVRYGLCSSKGEPLKWEEESPPSDEALTRWAERFAQEMDSLWQLFSGEITPPQANRDALAMDLVTLVAEALMNRTPWQLWDLKNGVPHPSSSTPRVLSLLEPFAVEPAVLPRHPGLLHLYIHVIEQSPTPQRGLRAADVLRELVPDSGHLCHMPSHLDALCGHFHHALVANQRAVIADRKMLQSQGPLNFYSLYRCHDLHFQAYAAMFLGQCQPALDAAEELQRTVPEELLRTEDPPMADWLEGFISVKVHVLVRFGRWRQLIDEPFPADAALYCVTTAMLHYGKGVAYAALGETTLGEHHLAELRLLLSGPYRVPESRYLFVNKCADILAIAEQMLEGELAYRQQRYGAAFAFLRRAVELEDTLPYDEPWGWMQPVRHALGALLLEQGHHQEAEEVYRVDLGLIPLLQRSLHHPENVWALAGLVECLQIRGDTVELPILKPRLDLARARCDVSVAVSCFCRLNLPTPRSSSSTSTCCPSTKEKGTSTH